MKAKAYHFTTH